MKFSIRDFALGTAAGALVGCLLGWAVTNALAPAPFTSRNATDTQRQWEELIQREEAQAKAKGS